MIGTTSEVVFWPIIAELGSIVWLKATAILSAAGLATLLLRRRSAATRSAVWNAALAVLLLLPILSVALPSWQLKDFEAFGTTAPPEVLVGDRSAVASPAPPSRQLQSGAATEGVPGEAPEAPPGAGTAAALLVLLWVGGSAFLLLRLGLHAARAYGMTVRASPAERHELDDVHLGRSGQDRPVRVLLSDDVSVPCSWGLWNPVVIIPAAAKTWPRERTRSVVLHELAHVVRRDHILHLVGEIVRALYWPNPLIWLAARRHDLERELACDDFVLRQDTSGADYASHLLQIARLQLEQRTAIGAVAMAEGPGLTERIQAVLNKRRDRIPVRPGGQALMAFLGWVLILPLATIDILGVHAGELEGSLEIPTVGELVGVLGNDADPLIRQRAAWWLGEHEARGGVPSLVGALEDGSPEVRVVAAWALGEIKDKRAIRALVRSLRDDHALVREMAALALGEIEDPSVVEPLAELFQADEEQRSAIVWSLGEIRGEDAERARREAFARWGRTPWENEEVWTGILEEHLASFEDLPSLLEQLRRGGPDARRRAALKLGQLVDDERWKSTAVIQEVVDTLLNALHDPAPSVRAAAVWALDEISPSKKGRGWLR
jgi:beta-lactamase regulating signal transducer with metallopeptidase domain